MPASFGHEAGEKTGIHIGGDAIEIKVERHAVCRADTKLYLCAVRSELTSLRQEEPVDPNASPIGIDIQRALETHDVQRSPVRMETQTAE